jgi:hypothetical protein
MRPITLILHIALDQETNVHGALIDPLTEQRRFFGDRESLWRALRIAISVRQEHRTGSSQPGDNRDLAAGESGDLRKE